jgi:hypothetical protein
MKEIRLWMLTEAASAAPMSLAAVDQTSTELLLEVSIVRQPDLLGDGMKLVGRQVDTPGGPLDLLGVDEDGSIVVYELKRGELTRDAVAQLLDYASYIAELGAADIGALVVKNSGRNGIEKISDFDAWYQQQFGKTFEVQRPKIALVGLGVDDRARRMVEFLANAGIEVSLLTFHGFKLNSETILARHVEVRQSSAATSAKATKDYNLQLLRKRVSESKARDFFEAAHNAIISWISPYAWPNQTGFTYSLPETTDAGTPTSRAYLSLAIPNPAGPAVLSIQDRTLAAGSTIWSKLESSWAPRITRHKGYINVRISSAADWAAISSDVHSLWDAVLETRRRTQEAEAKADTDVTPGDTEGNLH